MDGIIVNAEKNVWFGKNIRVYVGYFCVDE